MFTLPDPAAAMAAKAWRPTAPSIAILAHLLAAGLVIATMPDRAPAPVLPPRPVEVRFVQAERPRAPAPVVQSAPAEPAPPKPTPRAAPKPLPAPLAPAPAAMAPPPAAAPSGESAPAPTAPAPTAPAPAAPSAPTMTEARFDAAYLNNPKPIYPPAARRAGETGVVLLKVLVGEDGLAREVAVKTSSGSSRLDRSALETVATWKFVPARRGDVAVAAWVVVPIDFTLN